MTAARPAQNHALGGHFDPGPKPPLPPSRAAGTLDRTNHFVVIYQENWSFDSLYGRFPGANGIADAGAAARQVDKSGQPYAVLPRPIDTRKRPPAPDPRFPADLPSAPFTLAQFVLPTEETGDLIHKFYHEQYQINGGKMDKFVAWSDAAGLALSYYDATNWPVGRLAQQYVLADNFFHAAFGDSFLNYADGTPAKAQHLQDTQDLLQDLRRGTLPAVAFVKFTGTYNEHPANSDPMRGQKHVVDLVGAIIDSPTWAERRRSPLPTTSTADAGITWRHPSRTAGCPAPPNHRFPAREAPVHRPHKTFEVKWRLAPLGTRDAAANDLSNAFQ